MATRALKCARPVRVVLGPDQPDRRAALADLPLEIVTAEGTDGMAASIRAGVAGLKTGVMIVLCDMPDIRARDLYQLIGLWSQGLAPILRAAAEDGTPGQPVIFAKRYLKDLAKLTGDQGARALLQREAKHVALVPLDGQRATLDLDTPEAWAAWRAGNPL